MIDWVHALLPYRHSAPIDGGVVVSTDADGVVEWQTSKKRSFEGSFESHGVIRSSHQHFVNGEFTHIWVGGSPKVVQGHNLFGTSDPRLLAAAIARAALSSLGLETDPFTNRAWCEGRGVTFTVLDITEMLDTGTELDAAQWIESAQEHTRVKFRGRGVCQKGTLYFGQHSRRWALKLYQKFTELQSKKKGHALPESLPMRERLIDYARGTVRAEFRFHSMELKRLGLDDAAKWTPETSRQVWSRYMEQLELSGQRPLSRPEVDALPRSLRTSYLCWKEGRDMAGILSRATFYRHRRELLRFGIDLALTRQQQPGSNVVPLLRTVTAQPKAIPSWAYGTPLLLAA